MRHEPLATLARNAVPQGFDAAFRDDVLAGLAQRRKVIPARWLYDDRGSELFERITVLPAYYPTRAETEVLETRAGEIAALTGPGHVVVEFGSGSSTKTPHLLRAVDPSAYVPIDISGDFLRESACRIARSFPGLPVLPVEADFTGPVALPAQFSGLPALGFFPGSTIGNLVPHAAVDLLRSIRRTLGRGAQLLVGMDLVKDPGQLLVAYDDPEGVTAAFNLNLLDRINRELDGDVPVEAFAHRAIWNDALARIEMHLEARRNLDFQVSGRVFSMRTGETIHTENSHKYDARSASMLLLAGCWNPVARWVDSLRRFSVILAAADDGLKQP